MVSLQDILPSSARLKLLEESHDFKVISATFPRIGKKLEFYWGEREFHTLMDNLQQNDRDGQRTGFPADVLMALYSLALLHDKAYPKLARNEMSFWNRSDAH